MMYKIIIGCSLFFLMACQKQEDVIIIKIEREENYRGSTFNKPVFIDGSAVRDGGSIDFSNCIFENIEGDAVHINNTHTSFYNCTFRNVSGNAIYYSSEGITGNSFIEHNTFTNIGQSAIYAAGEHRSVQITENTFDNIGQNNSTADAVYSAIQVKGRDFRIRRNKIKNIGSNNKGNGITVSSTGEIASNIIANAAGHGIVYTADYIGYNGDLLIENNMLYDNEGAAIQLFDGDYSLLVSQITMRFNTLVSADQPLLAVNPNLTGIGIDWIANIAIRTDGSSPFVFSSLPYNQEKNITSSGDIGFVDFMNRDLHLGPNSSAENFAVGLTDFPSEDIDGQPRQANSLDAGADER